jgi:hypothetical protein
LQTPDFDTSDFGGLDEGYLGLTDDNQYLHQEPLPQSQDYLADEHLLQEIGKSINIERDFCISIWSNPDDTSRWVRPTWKEKMLGVSAIIERDCRTKFTIATIIAEIADWRINNKNGPLTVIVKMKNKEDIDNKYAFNECYDMMNKLYDKEMKGRRLMLNYSRIISRSRFFVGYWWI